MYPFTFSYVVLAIAFVFSSTYIITIIRVYTEYFVYYYPRHALSSGHDILAISLARIYKDNKSRIGIVE